MNDYCLVSSITSSECLYCADLLSKLHKWSVTTSWNMKIVLALYLKYIHRTLTEAMFVLKCTTLLAFLNNFNIIIGRSLENDAAINSNNHPQISADSNSTMAEKKQYFQLVCMPYKMCPFPTLSTSPTPSPWVAPMVCTSFTYNIERSCICFVTVT